jgi:type I site-specific restriction-modification system R (restriction) subunit
MIMNIKYKERIAIIADEAHRSHGKQWTRNVHTHLTGDTTQTQHITYFSFTSTPTPRGMDIMIIAIHK